MNIVSFITARCSHMSSPTCCHKDPPLTLAPPPPRQAYDSRLELDLGGGLDRFISFMRGLELRP